MYAPCTQFADRSQQNVELCFANIYVVWECWGGIILPKNCAKIDQYKPIYR
ncbi:hypothetical protein [Klebsiella phage vB_KpnS-VAC9]|uniref:Uncharacterized protein n=1 Tax=Klebsiella phage vB_KpnS-VAC10 TaxID=2864368 RepID=A0AAE7XHB0_9CAUD|nr:hypothetical protein [Klebsiella phage vB_KpnS-VAC9]QZE50923.1 hypothetical protein [Klebsiella phage vB_KpnS-VAC10]